MSRDKEFEQRMQGMVYACRLAQEQGIEALVKDVKQRGVTKVDITASDKQLADMWGALSDNIGQNMLTTVVWVLHDTFGFGQKRLQQFMTEFDKAAANLMSLDYMGEHYVTLEDYAVELNQKYNLGLDVIKATLATDMAIQALEEVQQYSAIGTPKECRAAAVKQTAKKPIFSHNLSDTLSVFHCECGNTIKVSHDIGIMNNNNVPNYCSKCGCKLDWSDEE